jgi:hypothetical protein
MPTTDPEAPTQLTPLQVQENAVAKELWEWREELYRRAEQWYPDDVFPVPPKGEPYKTPDGAAAAMARRTLRAIAADLGQRSIDLTHDDPEE